MKKVLVLLLSIMQIMCSAAFAEYHPATASPTPAPYGWVRGTVTDAADSTIKLSGVSVSVNGQTARTDSQGKYEFQLKPGSWTMTFKKDGYNDASYTVQVQPAAETRKDCQLEQKQGWVYGVVSDATNPSIKLSGVKITVDGRTIQTNSNGEYEIQLNAGNWNLTFSKDGFINATQSVRVQSDERVQANCSMSRLLSSDQYRVVLTWGDTPSDLDSHLLGTSSRNVQYHVYFSAKKPSSANNEAELDVDDTSSYGPETTTFKINNNATYVFYIHNYSDKSAISSRRLSQSNAKVTVYNGNELLSEFEVPSGPGIYWEVFRIENGVFIPVNVIKNSPPSQ